MPTKKKKSHKTAGSDMAAMLANMILAKKQFPNMNPMALFAQAMLGSHGSGPDWSRGDHKKEFEEFLKHHHNGGHFKGFSKKVRREKRAQVSKLHQEAGHIYMEYGKDRDILERIEDVIVSIKKTRSEFFKEHHDDMKYKERTRAAREVQLSTGVADVGEIVRRINKNRERVVTSAASALQGNVLGEIPPILKIPFEDGTTKAPHEKTLRFYERAYRVFLQVERFRIHYTPTRDTSEFDMYSKMKESDKIFRQLQHDTTAKKKHGKPRAKKPRKTKPKEESREAREEIEDEGRDMVPRDSERGEPKAWEDEWKEKGFSGQKVASSCHKPRRQYPSI